MKHCCKCKCDCKPTCEELLVKGHLVYKDSIAKFVESDDLIQYEMRKTILYALSLIEKRKELQRIALDEENEALEILGLYEEKCTCDNNIERCLPLLEEALAIFKIESEKVADIEELLLKILCLLDQYDQIRKDGDFVFFEKWLPCLHKKDHC